MESGELPKQHGKLEVKLIAVGIVFDSSLQKVPAEVEVFALGFDAQCLARLFFILHRGDRGIPRHVPRGHVPVGERARLKRRNGIEQPRHAAPLGIFPSRVGFDPKNGRERGAESTERGEKPRLADALAQLKQKN